MADWMNTSFKSFFPGTPVRRAVAAALAAGILFLASCQDPSNPAADAALDDLENELAIGFGVTPGTYTLKVVHSGKCVDVAGPSTADGANLQQWACNGNTNQQFALKDLGNGVYEVKAAHSGKCMDVSGWSAADGGNIHQWGCNGQNNQKWILVDMGGDQYQLRSAHSGKCADVAGISTADGANIQQWACYNVGQQKFTLAAVTPKDTTGSGGTNPSAPTFGWKPAPFTYKIQKPWNLPLGDRYSHEPATGIHKHWVFKGDLPHSQGSNTGARCEMRWNQEYQSGQHMFDADVNIANNTIGSIVMQIKRLVEFPQAGATDLHIVVWPEDGGRVTTNSTNAPVIIRNAYDRWWNLKVSHNPDTREIRVYANNVLVHTQQDKGPAIRHFKNGVYNVQGGERAMAQFRNIKYWIK